MSKLPDFSSHNYQIIRELGRNREGGRISYLANNLETDEQVVIKQFRFVQELSSWRGFKAYEREIEILQEINHPRIPKYLDSFETSDGFCMVQEYKNAPTLASRSSFSPELIKEISISILEILVDLQARIPPVIHRDIKPENILVDTENNAYLIDFGLARIRSEDIAISSVAAGTPGFMPPEELFNRPLTVASDLYSLGATLICLLTKTRSVNLSNLIDENYRFNFNHLVKEVNPRFIAWLNKMVEPNVKERYSNAAIALEALKSLELMGTAKDEPKEVNKSKFLKPLVIGSITLAILELSLRLVTNFLQPSTVEQTIVTQSLNPPNTTATRGREWFNQIKPRCNAVEVMTAIRALPPPNDPEGIGYAAGCYALAGKIKKADSLIQQLPENAQAYAAGIVFNIGHPVADAGDDESAGPIMELVLKYSPENYMALYHAGMSEYALGDLKTSQKHLEKFLQIYQNNDGWRQNAMTVLRQIKHRSPQSVLDGGQSPPGVAEPKYE